MMGAKVLYFDAFAGISGDMAAGALLDLGGGARGLKRALDSLRLGIGFTAARTYAHRIGATKFRVRAGAAKHHRTFGEIRRIIARSRLSPAAKEKAIAMFGVLAGVEGRLHGVRPAAVRFHEVGAADSIADIVAVAHLAAGIAPRRVVFSPLPLGGGFVQCRHGRLPVPAPATVELLRGVPVYDDGRKGETVTPTGAAIARVLADGYGGIPAMRVVGTGYGAGDRVSDTPNVLRVLLGEEEGTDSGEAVEMSANMDDMSPEVAGYLFDRLLEAGALDVFITPVQMKKNRPGILLTVLGREDDLGKLARIVLKESSTFGLRHRKVGRICLDRRFSAVRTRFGRVRIKEGLYEGKVLKRVPEYEDCRKLAKKRKVPFLEVYRAALARAG